EFFKSIQSIDFLRLRASYGRTGNSRIGTYTAVGLYDLSDRENGYQAGGQYANINPNVPPNPNLGWEVNKKFNIGIDVDFLGRFSLTTDFFHDNIEDMIVSREIIAESGYSSARINGASMFNQGLELSLNAEWFKNSKWKWRTSVNFTRIRNKVTSLTGLESAFSTASVARAQRVGQPTSALWGINFVGIDPATGRELFEVNGEVFDAVTIRNDFDETIWSPIGDTQPDLFGGINNTLTYGNISLQVIMSYEVGGDFFVQRSLIDNYNDLVFRNPPVEVFYDAWRSPGDVAILPVITTFNPIVNNSSKYVYDNSHLKLKSVTIKYHIPLEEHKLPLNSLDVSLNGSNLYYWFREQTPEGRNGIAELRNQYPEMRAFTLRVSAAF
ncbi:MAG: SusC/RagA family TonB-linked outer membrane protein, partial [Bacteroidota bacterium]